MKDFKEWLILNIGYDYRYFEKHCSDKEKEEILERYYRETSEKK